MNIWNRLNFGVFTQNLVCKILTIISLTIFNHKCTISGDIKSYEGANNKTMSGLILRWNHTGVSKFKSGNFSSSDRQMDRGTWWFRITPPPSNYSLPPKLCLQRYKIVFVCNQSQIHQNNEIKQKKHNGWIVSTIK